MGCRRRGQSWKARLKAAIDAVIPQAKDFDDFLRLMAAQGYEIKQGQIYLVPRPRTGTLHPLQDAGRELHRGSHHPPDQGGWPWTEARTGSARGSPYGSTWRTTSRAQQSAGYTRWAKLQNLKQAAKTINFLTEHGIEQYAELKSKVAEISAANDAAAAALKDVWNIVLRGHGGADKEPHHLQAAPGPWCWNTARPKTRPRSEREHESQLILYEAAAKAIKDAGDHKATQSGRPESRVPGAGQAESAGCTNSTAKSSES